MATMPAMALLDVAHKHPTRAQSRRADLDVAELARRQHGYAAYWQLREIGLGRGAIRHRSESGWLHRVHRGVYAVGHTATDVYGPVMAAVLRCGPGALLSHAAAAWLWGVWSDRAARVDVTRVGRGRLRWGNIVVHHVRSIDDEDKALRENVPVTSLARTLLDNAATKPRRVVARMIEEADRRALFDLSAVERLCARDPGRPGAGLLARILTDFRPEPFTRSEFERALLEVCRAAGLPPPETNVVVEGFEVDALWREARLVVELDSRAYHLNPTAFEEDRLRDARLQLAGYRVLRITWRRLMEDPTGVVAQIRALLA